ncbi:MAG: ABC transporter ATP-binding protein [Acidimicrobiales bacterium]
MRPSRPGLPDELRRGGRRMMRRALRPSRRWIVIGVLTALGWTAAKVTVPLLAQRAVDRGIDHYDAEALLWWTAVLVAVTGITAVCTALRRYAAFAISLRAETDLRRQLFAHLQRLHFAFHDRAQTGELMSRANTDLRQIQLFLVFVPVAGANVVMIVGVTAVLLSINVKLALLALAPLPLLAVAAVRFSRRLHPEAADLQGRLADVSGVVEETLAGIRVVKGFGAEPLQEAKLRGAAAAVERRALSIARLRAGFNPAMELLPTLGLVVVLFVGGREVLADRLTIGQLVAFNAYILQLIFPLRLTALLVAAASRASVSAARVHEVLATAPEITDRPAAIGLPDGPGEVRFEGVTFGYRNGPTVFRDLDLLVPGGSSVALVGATGSGKSTLARLIARFYDVDGGAVRLDGADVRDLRLDELRRSVGIVFEDTFLFTDSVYANIALADAGASVDRVEEAARLAGAADFISGLPAGYETVLGEHGFSLSGGQRQRVAIARAILADPRVLVLDDATSAVDPTKEHEIRDALRQVMHGRTTIVIAHRAATVALADRVVLLDGGEVVAEGTHDQLIQGSARYREVLAHAEAHAAPRATAVP